MTDIEVQKICNSTYDPLDFHGYLTHAKGENKMFTGHIREIGGRGQYALPNIPCELCGNPAGLHKIIFRREFHQ